MKNMNAVRALIVSGLLCAPVIAQNAAPMNPQEKSNLNLVLNWWREGFIAHHPDAVNKYFADDFVQHNPNFAPGKAGIVSMVSRRPAIEAPATLPPEERPVVATSQGDIVSLMFERKDKDPQDPSKMYPFFVIDIFRVRDGKIVEHWDAAKKNPAQSR